ncbi:MAG: sensor histidine kinase [Chloroflexota bacterium]|nr:sensor histidine kinase [Chloroflexota bacterium]
MPEESLAPGPFTLPPEIIPLAMGIGFGMPLLASLLPLWHGTRIPVRETFFAYGIHTAFEQKRASHVRKRLDLTWPPQTVWYGLRSLFRKCWRAALMLFTLTLTGMGFLVVQTITTSINDSVSSVYTHLDADVEVDVGEGSFISLGAQLQALHNVARIERYGVGGRVARDLHDSVKQHTFALTLLIGAGKKYLERDTSQARLYFTEAEELADQIRQELTTIIQELRPLALTEKGLATALQEYSRQWSRRTGIAASVSIQKMPSLPPKQEETVFRVIQEALTNVARHSKASKISVHLSWQTKQVCLLVHNNGQGFDILQATGKGLGLTIMRERIEASQGTIYISSTNEGTRIEACLPCANDERQWAGTHREAMIDE